MFCNGLHLVAQSMAKNSSGNQPLSLVNVWRGPRLSQKLAPPTETAFPYRNIQKVQLHHQFQQEA